MIALEAPINKSWFEYPREKPVNRIQRAYSNKSNFQENFKRICETVSYFLDELNIYRQSFKVLFAERSFPLVVYKDAGGKSILK